jgi:hypothetical protein
VLYISQREWRIHFYDAPITLQACLLLLKGLSNKGLLCSAPANVQGGEGGRHDMTTSLKVKAVSQIFNMLGAATMPKETAAMPPSYLHAAIPNLEFHSSVKVIK